MEKRGFDFMQLWRVSLLWAIACAIGPALSLNDQGQLLLNWKQEHLDDPDNNLRNWNASDSTPCFWNGVNCTQGSVSALDLSPFWKLAGPIDPLTFAKFANLTTLHVGNTSLNGVFPQDIVNCSKLVYLNISFTWIGGEVPADIISLQRLQVLDLGYAELEGTVVSRIEELHELRVLRLDRNHFQGQMPLIQSILSLTKLQELTLSGNDWNGSLSVGFFTIPNLKVLWLGSNLGFLNVVPWPNFSVWESMEDLRLTGVKFPQAFFPAGTFKMTKLRTLHLSRCNIVGPFPSLQNLTHLEELNLATNMLTGHIPDMFGGMPNLTVLWVYENQLTGPFPASLWQCKRLRELITYNNDLNGDWTGVANLNGTLALLDLANNNFSGEIPASLGTLTRLEGLYLFSNSFSGEIPPSLGNLSLLTLLDLANNNFSGEIPASLGTLSRLEGLYLFNNSFSGEIPPSLGNLSLLTLLSLSSNNLSGTIPPELANMESLVQLRLDNNKFTGEIPYNLGRKSFLEYVDLGINRLEGHIPPYICWGNNVSLQFLALFENKLTGTIPETYGNCTNLGVVRLDNNQLEGPVPTGLWGGVELYRMHLNGNNFSGSIDANIGKATNLSILYLQDNSFSGPIPNEIGRTKLVKFQAYSNKLNGTLTPLLGNLSHLMELMLGANSFNGTIPINLGNCTELVQLDLSKNHLEGAIPDEFTYLNKLSTLDLSENNLTGAIPTGLFSVSTLQTLNVAFNNLSGVIPNQENGLMVVTVNFTGNPFLCVEGSCGSNTSSLVISSLEGGRKEIWPIFVGVFVVIALGLFVLSVLVFKRCKGDSDELHADEDMWTVTSFTDKIFHHKEIAALDEDNVIGVGGSGKVYKVTLGDGKTVAVKKLWSVTKEESSKNHGFDTEVKTLASIQHQNIVKLLCSCTNKNCNLLVYEYMPRGSLGDLLHSTKSETLPWKIRHKIVIGAATGLQFLHDNCTPQILHRDIKSNNILLDLDYKAYLTDFGIAKIVETAASHTMSTIAGSLGYMAPEYSFSARLNEKIDVYSFGVVLLELVTGKRAIDPTIYGDTGTNLVQWVNDKVQTPENMYEILDPNCETSSHEDMLASLQIAMLCTSLMPASRPSMCDVVTLLTSIAPKSHMDSEATVSC